jgi:uncharacterized membrane protein YraQ (UPF0718 family)
MNLIGLLQNTVAQVWHTLAANWPFLAISAVIAALLRVYVDQNKVAGFLQRHRSGGVLAATAAAVGTPLCSCGTTAIILGMMASLMPWAPIVAFMVASPLTSPEELLYSAGLFGWPFALTFFGASIVLGLMGGLAAHVLEGRGLLKNQMRFRPISGGSGLAPAAEIGVKSDVLPLPSQADWRIVLIETGRSGWRLLIYFLGFAFIGYLLNGLLPSTWVSTLFSSGRFYSVPLAATLGVPFYLNTEASLPLVLSLLDAGMSPGAALAFLITGAGTSIGAIGGALTIARWRVVGLVIATLWVGAVIFGFGYNAVLAAGLF